MSYFIVDSEYVRDHLTDTVIVDVRPVGYYEEAHIPGAVNVPFMALRDLGGNVGAHLAAAFRSAGVDEATPVIVYCQNGGLARMACGLLAAQGFSGLICYEGSWGDWVRGWDNPVEKTAHERARAA